MRKDYGEPIRYDPNFNGPIHNRSCTDILFLIAFVVFLGVWGFVGVYGIKNGDINRLLAPIDSKGRRCGLDSGVENKKYLMFFDITKCLSPGSPITGCQTPQVCVEKCPDQTMLFTEPTWAPYKSKIVCVDDDTTKQVQSLSWTQTYANYIDKDICTRYIIQSEPVLDRCVVNATALIGINLVDQIGELTEDQVHSASALALKSKELAAQIVQDLKQSRWYLLGALFAVIVLCFIYILLLRWVVAPVVWASIAGLFALLGFLLYFCYINYDYYKKNNVNLAPTTNVEQYAKSIFNKPETWMVLLVVIAVVTLILLLIVIFLRARIVIAIALLKEGSKAVCAVKSTVFFPIFPWILQCLTIAYGVLVLMYLMSIGESAFKVANLNIDTNCTCNGKYTQDYEKCTPLEFLQSCQSKFGGACQLAYCHFSGLDSTNSVYLMQFVNLLAFFWTMFFISGIADMMLASTFSTWYWTFHKKDLPFFTLTSGIYRTLRYHMGTVAFGALIIAIVRVIRVILEYIDHKLKKFDNPFTRCVLCCCKCFFWCLESFLKFINKNAYIMCAVHGKAFCASARDAFSLLLRNIVRVVVLDKVTDFIFFLSKLLISVGVGLAVYYLLEWQLVYDVTNGERLHYNYVPAVILAIATYLISTIFFNVYAMAVDTLFLCFLEDCERNDGSPEKPYFMSKNLMKILGKKNKRAKEE